jgi:Fe-S-cluster containining protein
VDRDGKFSYTCNQCGLCCRDQVITLSPYDVIRIARAAGIATGDAVRQYTLRHGSLLKFTDQRTCEALDGARCTIHHGRPLACRLYPLGLQRDPHGGETFVPIEPAAGSRGVYGEDYGKDGTVAEFLDAQGVDEYLHAIGQYRRLLPLMRDRIAALVDFDVVEPREFWRVAVREALAEANFDPNPLIDALFDPDSLSALAGSLRQSVADHTRALEIQIRAVTEVSILAAAAVLLAVSLGYSPAEAGAI